MSEVGISHYEVTRRNWTLNHVEFDPKRPPQDHLAHIKPESYEQIYINLATRTLANPLPLEFIVKVLYYCWKKQGLLDDL